MLTQESVTGRSTSPLDKLLLAHPRTQAESYIQHMIFTLNIGIHMFAAGIVVIIHGLIPGLFTNTGGDMAAHVHQTLQARRRDL